MRTEHTNPDHGPTNANLDELFKLYFNLPFNRFLGLSLITLDERYLSLEFPMKPEFIGNNYKNILHGGVISSAIDACGGLHAMSASYKKMQQLPKQEIINRLKNSSTIDLRVDYLRPGEGQLFTVPSELLRSGRRVSVSRMKLINENGSTLAAGSATYLIATDQ